MFLRSFHQQNTGQGCDLLILTGRRLEKNDSTTKQKEGFGMMHSHKERMKKIEDFFNGRSTSEIENFLIQAGAGVIQDSRESDYVKVFCCDTYNYKRDISLADSGYNEYLVSEKTVEKLKGAA